MILEEETLIKYGYLPMDLPPQSNKPILAACGDCGKIRTVRKQSYRSLCISCAEKGNTYRLGITQTEEAKAKNSATQKGKTHTEETKALISAAAKGRVFSEECKANISAALKGRKLTDAHKANLSAANKGENSPNWQGGISFEPYCIKFNKAYKEHIRDLFGNECFLCGKPEVNNGRKLDVHHVNYNKNCGCGETKCICVPLCMRCHTKTNADRDFWKCLITEMLKPFAAWEL